MDREKLKEFIKNYKAPDFTENCKKGNHRDICIGMSDSLIWWKCSECDRTRSEEATLMTI